MNVRLSEVVKILCRIAHDFFLCSVLLGCKEGCSFKQMHCRLSMCKGMYTLLGTPGRCSATNRHVAKKYVYACLLPGTNTLQMLYLLTRLCTPKTQSCVM